MTAAPADRSRSLKGWSAIISAVAALFFAASLFAILPAIVTAQAHDLQDNLSHSYNVGVTLDGAKDLLAGKPAEALRDEEAVTIMLIKGRGADVFQVLNRLQATD